MYRILKKESVFKPSKKTKPVQNAEYRSWIATLPCMIDLTYGVEAAHVSKATVKCAAGQPAADKC